MLKRKIFHPWEAGFISGMHGLDISLFKLLKWGTMFVCGISLTSGQLINELFPDCLKVMLFVLFLMHRGRDSIYEMIVCGGSLTSGQLVKGSFQTRCLFAVVGHYTHSIVLPNWDNIS